MSFAGNPSVSLGVKGKNLTSREGHLFLLDNVATEPTATTGDGSFVLYRYGGLLKLWDGSSRTTLGSAGSLVNFSLDDAYDD